MGVVYFDSSALVKLLVDEPGRDTVTALWDRCDVAVSSTLAYAEVRAALAAAARCRRLTPTSCRRAVAEWDDYWSAMHPVQVTTAIAREAGHLAGEHRLRGADSVHLASMVAIGTRGTVVAVWDDRLRQAASARGFPVTA
jgi:uncharacterized protein